MRDDNYGNAVRFNSVFRPRKGSFNSTRFDRQAELDPKVHGKRKGEYNFYVTNFPENWKSKDLMEIFPRYGKVKDNTITNKRNRMGWKFAYAIFYDCNLVSSLEKSLDSAWIGSFSNYR